MENATEAVQELKAKYLIQCHSFQIEVTGEKRLKHKRLENNQAFNRSI